MSSQTVSTGNYTLHRFPNACELYRTPREVSRNLNLLVWGGYVLSLRTKWINPVNVNLAAFLDCCACGAQWQWECSAWLLLSFVIANEVKQSSKCEPCRFPGLPRLRRAM